MNSKNNNSTNRESKAKIYFSVFFSLYTVFTLAAIALNLILYSSYYDPTLKLFANNFLSKSAYILTAASFVIALVTLFIPYFKTQSEPKSPSSSDSPVKSKGFIVFVECLCGLFLVMFSLNHYILRIGSISNYRYIIATLALIIGALYFFLQAFSANIKKTYAVLTGLCLVVFLIGYIFFDLYRIDNILVNSPIRIGSILASVSLMLFILSELRFYISRASNNLYFSASFLAVIFSVSDSLPRIYLSIIQKNGFSFDSKAFFACFELFAGIYAFTRLCSYMAEDAFSDGDSSDEYDDEYEYIEISDEDEIESGEQSDTSDETDAVSEYDGSENTDKVNGDENRNSESTFFNADSMGELDIDVYNAAQELPDDLPDDGEDVHAKHPSDINDEEDLTLEKKIISELIALIPDDLEAVIDFEGTQEGDVAVGEDTAEPGDKDGITDNQAKNDNIDGTEDNKADNIEEDNLDEEKNNGNG